MSDNFSHLALTNSLAFDETKHNTKGYISLGAVPRLNSIFSSNLSTTSKIESLAAIDRTSVEKKHAEAPNKLPRKKAS